MKLNAEQQKKVEDNLGLVNKVINDKVHGPYYLGMYTRDDLFQIGCIGLMLYFSFPNEANPKLWEGTEQLSLETQANFVLN